MDPRHRDRIAFVRVCSGRFERDMVVRNVRTGKDVRLTRAMKLFGCDHANVQPLSGSPMNQAVYFAFLKPGDVVLAMDLSHGGHLTHGAPVSHMGKVFNFVRYKTHPDQGGAIDFDELKSLAKETRPKMVLCGYSSYPRDYEYAQFKAVADEVGAFTMADISHIGGLVAAGTMRNPFDADFDVVTTTTHKTLRGPRGGLILCKKDYASQVDAAVFPGLQGGPHMNAVAGAAVTFKKAAQPEFRTYAVQVMSNAKALAAALMDEGVSLITSGTDNHMMVIDVVKSFGIDGRAAQEALDAIGITANKQVIPDDPLPPVRPSGVRLGTPACTTRGMDEGDMRRIGGWIAAALRAPDDAAALERMKNETVELCRRYPVPGIG
jgi:glycine hydroxymethyltransferase